MDYNLPAYIERADLAKSQTSSDLFTIVDGRFTAKISTEMPSLLLLSIAPGYYPGAAS